MKNVMLSGSFPWWGEGGILNHTLNSRMEVNEEKYVILLSGNWHTENKSSMVLCEFYEYINTWMWKVFIFLSSNCVTWSEYFFLFLKKFWARIYVVLIYSSVNRLIFFTTVFYFLAVFAQMLILYYYYFFIHLPIKRSMP